MCVLKNTYRLSNSTILAWIKFKNQNQKQIYYQEEFYTNEEFVSVNKVHALKTINNKQTMTSIYIHYKQYKQRHNVRWLIKWDKLRQKSCTGMTKWIKNNILLKIIKIVQILHYCNAKIQRWWWVWVQECKCQWIKDPNCRREETVHVAGGFGPDGLQPPARGEREGMEHCSQSPSQQSTW